MIKKNYYDILGVSSEATEEEIRDSFHKLARLYHPDLNKGRIYHEKFIAINKAYTVLKNKISRQAYDFTLREKEDNNAPKVTFGNFNPGSHGTPGNTYTPSYSPQTPKENTAEKKPEKRYINRTQYTFHIKAAYKAFNEKSYVKAMKETDLAISNYERSDMAHELKGDILMVYANYNEAMTEYELAVQYCKKDNPNYSKVVAKLEDCKEKMKPEKENFLLKLKRKFFDSEN